ncbi:UDP-glycosyltransferase 73C5 [Ananas comosus]|uniref:Glycosyltransferase n=1 Tax=Ananas comosus TaxID=4615 RepID=A0A199UPF8_ANACO|nr:UDP-glycosyltransferase 73C5 [Ananas comosus]
MVTSGSVPSAPPHFVLVPLLAQGHLIPAMDIAALLTARGAAVTLIATPVNAARLRPLADRLPSSPSPPPPSASPRAARTSTSSPPRPSTSASSAPPQRSAGPSPPSSAPCRPRPLLPRRRHVQPLAADVAADLGLPRLVFHGPSCLTVLSFLSAQRHGLIGPGAAAAEPFEIPGVPHRITATRAEVPGWFNVPAFEELLRSILEAEAAADGVVLNTFEFLEGDSAAAYGAMLGKPVHCIGPLCLSTKDSVGNVGRGGDAAVDTGRCVEWLAAKNPRSVIYVSFGSLTYVPPKQVIEIGEGLAAAGAPFVFVIKKSEVASPEVAQWLSGEGGFEDRNKEKGMVIRGWAPQAVILSHPSVGGFVTHCGWNSVLDGVTAGLPAICWPHFADQFMNKRLVVDVLRTGVDVGIKGPLSYVDPNSVQLVTRQEVERAVRSVMDGGEEAEERRQKAAKLAEEARKAVEEGGSSYRDLDRLLQFPSQKYCNAAYCNGAG